MKLNYTVISSSPLKVKFFYEGSDNNRYGEFYVEFTRMSKDAANMTDKLGVTGTAEVFAKDPDYARDLIMGFTEALLPRKEQDDQL